MCTCCSPAVLVGFTALLWGWFCITLTPFWNVLVIFRCSCLLIWIHFHCISHPHRHMLSGFPELDSVTGLTVQGEYVCLKPDRRKRKKSEEELYTNKHHLLRWYIFAYRDAPQSTPEQMVIAETHCFSKMLQYLKAVSITRAHPLELCCCYPTVLPCQCAYVAKFLSLLRVSSSVARGCIIARPPASSVVPQEKGNSKVMKNLGE